MATQPQHISEQEIDRYKQQLKAGVLAGILGPERIEQLDRWIKKQEDPSLDCDEAVRRLVDIGLFVTVLVILRIQHEQAGGDKVLELEISDDQKMLDEFLQTLSVRQLKMLREIALGLDGGVLQ